MILIKNANIITMANTGYSSGYLLCVGNQIRDLGSMAECPSEEVLKVLKEEAKDDKQTLIVIDANGKNVYPGLIDAHCHVGMQEDGVGTEGEDLNEDTDPLTPHIKAVDGIYYMDRSFNDACEAGVTTCVTGPGSANAIGGVFAAIKTDNRDISQMLLKENAAMKFAFGQNPKFVYGDKKVTPTTRMATVALMREILEETGEYAQKLKRYEENSDEEEKPDFDIKKEALLPVLKGELPVKAHAHRADDILTAIKLSKRYGFHLTLEHATEGHLIADCLSAENVGVIYGPIITERCKTELKNHTAKTPGILADKGIEIAIMTDHPCVPIQYLALSAMVAVKNGMDYEKALRAITITAANLAGISDRVGTLEVGKDADIIITDGDILELKTNILYTIINGEIAYERK